MDKEAKTKVKPNRPDTESNRSDITQRGDAQSHREYRNTDETVSYMIFRLKWMFWQCLGAHVYGAQT